MKIKLLFVLLSLFPAFCFATIYQWKDEQGQTHFGQEPPPQTDATEVHPAVAPATPNAQAKPKAQAEHEVTKEKEKPDAKSQAKEEAPLDPKTIEDMKINCERAKQFLEELESKPRIRLQDGSGNVTALPDEVRTQKIEDTKKVIKKNCKENKE